MHKRLWSIVALFLCVLFVTGCQKNNQKPSDKIQVVSTLNFYGEVAKAVGGNKVQVTDLIDNPNEDPHDFEPTTKTAKTLLNAQYIIKNGAGYDEWVKKITPDHAKTISVSDLAHKKDGDNPHLWYNVDNMEQLANHLAADLGNKDVNNKKYYQKNAQEYVKKLRPIKQQIKDIKQKSNNQFIAVTEPVYNYTLQQLGYRIIDQKLALDIENETDPAPKAIGQLQSEIKKHKIAFMVNNVQTENKVTKDLLQLAKVNKIPVVNVTETMPQNKDYPTWITNQLNQISKTQRSN